VRSDPPEARDCWSHKPLGIPLLDPNKERLWEGVSVFDSLEQARKKARRYPDKGQYIAVLAVESGDVIVYSQTGRRREGHHTLWGDPLSVWRASSTSYLSQEKMMKTTDELWDTATSNLVGTYPTQEAALTVVRDAVAKHGPRVFADIALGREDQQGELIPVAQGDALVQLAMNAESTSPRRSGAQSAAR
jgi:hypothetical protein